jgi:Uma2 family endonuclease
VADSPDYQDLEVELWEGELVEMAKPNPYHSLIVLEIIFRLRLYLQQNPALKFTVFHDNTEFAPTEDILIVPDVAVVPSHLLSLPLPQSLPFMPLLAVEVLSPGNSAPEMDRKLYLYFRYGVQFYWEVYPESRSVRVYRLNESGQLVGQLLTASDTLTGDPLIPGFSLPVAQLFPTLG